MARQSNRWRSRERYYKEYYERDRQEGKLSKVTDEDLTPFERSLAESKENRERWDEQFKSDTQEMADFWAAGGVDFYDEVTPFIDEAEELRKQGMSIDLGLPDSKVEKKTTADPAIMAYKKKLNNPYKKFWDKIRGIQRAIELSGEAYRKDILNAFPKKGQSQYPYVYDLTKVTVEQALESQLDDLPRAYQLWKIDSAGKRYPLITNTGAARNSQYINIGAPTKQLTHPAITMQRELGSVGASLFGHLKHDMPIEETHKSAYTGPKEFLRRLMGQTGSDYAPIFSHTAMAVIDDNSGEEYMSKLIRNNETDFGNPNRIKKDVETAIENFKENLEKLCATNSKTFNTSKVRNLTKSKLHDFGWKQEIDAELNAEYKLQNMWAMAHRELKSPGMPKSTPRMMYAWIWGKMDSNTYLKAVSRNGLDGIQMDTNSQSANMHWRDYCDPEWVEVAEEDPYAETSTKFIAQKPWWLG